MQCLSAIRGNLERLFEDTRTVGVTPLSPEEIGQVDQGGNEARIEDERALELGLRLGGAAQPHIEIGQVQMCLRLVSIDRLRGDEFRQRPFEVGLLHRESACGGAGERVGCCQAHGPHGIAEAGGGKPYALGWQECLDDSQGCCSHRGRRRPAPPPLAGGTPRSDTQGAGQRCRPRDAGLARVGGERGQRLFGA